VEGKGLGLVALKNIPAQSRILVERGLALEELDEFKEQVDMLMPA